MTEQMKNTLILLGNRLNSADIVWGVGASLMLHQHGLYDNPKDMDIVVILEDIVKAKNAIDSIGASVNSKSNTVYVSDYFYKYEINGIGIDLMAGFKICHENGIYKYNFDKNSVNMVAEFGGIEVPFCALEDWLTMYRLMPRGREKALLISSYLDENN